MIDRKKLTLCICTLLALSPYTSIYTANLIVHKDIGPYHTVQEAYDAAADSGDTILLTAGYTYTGNGNVNLTFSKDFSLGRIGTGTDPVIDMENNANTRFCIISNNHTVTIQHLTLARGNENEDYGGAIIIDYLGALQAQDCTFSNNNAYYGGAIYNKNSLQAANCVFMSNTAQDAGAIFNEKELIVTECSFCKNSAHNIGGALYQQLTTFRNTRQNPHAHSSISGCHFIHNTAEISCNAICSIDGTVDARNNWWNTNKPEPETLFGDSVITYDPWMLVTLSPDPLTLRHGKQTCIAADFRRNSSGQYGNYTLFENKPIIFRTSEGLLTTNETYIEGGLAHTTLYDIHGTHSYFALTITTDNNKPTCYSTSLTAQPLGIYVSALHGNDTYAGTIDNPVKTIAKGIELAIATPKYTPSIFLEAGNIFNDINDKELDIRSSLSFDRYHDGGDPIIDLENNGWFLHISPGCTVTLTNLEVTNGNAINGSAIWNYGGTLNTLNCKFTHNKSHEAGGAIINDKGSLNVQGCSFIGNSASYGGAVENFHGNASINGCTFNGNNATIAGGSIKTESLLGLTIHCSRFIHNTATTGNEVANYLGTVDATDNWWGTNLPDSNSLFYAQNPTKSPIIYAPYLTINLTQESLHPTLFEQSLITADITHNSNGTLITWPCFFNGLVNFGASSGTLSAPSCNLVQGKAITTLTDMTGSPTLTLYVTADSDLDTSYTFSQTAEPLCATYVSILQGNDNNPGTIAAPVKTIQRGLQIAASHSYNKNTGTHHILLEAGNIFSSAYDKNLTIKNNIVFAKYHEGPYPTIDMQKNGRFCTIDNGVTVTIQNLIIKNGNADFGGAFENHGTLYTRDSIFSNNHAYYNGGFIYNENGSYESFGCTFNLNHAESLGGVVWNNGNVILNYNRFARNESPEAPAIYNAGGYIVNAINNWWGCNNPSPQLFYGAVTWSPYIKLNLLPNPLKTNIYRPATIEADFTRNSAGNILDPSMFEGTPIHWNSSCGYTEPGISSVHNGRAKTRLYTDDITCTSPFKFSANIDSDLTSEYYTYQGTAIPVEPTVIYVSSSDGQDSNDGNYNNPLRTIKAGIDRATSSACSILYLEEGSTFSGENNNNITIQDAHITIDTYIKNHGNEKPVIDLQGSDRLFTIRSKSFVKIRNVDIRNGYQKYGGALYINAATRVIIENCIFSHNISYGTTFPVDGGGAILSNGDLAVIHCTFYDNNATMAGGALYNYNGNLTTHSCTFNDNKAQYGGTVLNYAYDTQANANHIQCSFNNNHATIAGGALYNYGVYSNANLYVTDCTLSNNMASEYAGSIANSNDHGTSVVKINCNRFVKNKISDGNVSEIYNFSSDTIDATNNWWGTNKPTSRLFHGPVAYEPYLRINLAPADLQTLVADFTQNSSGVIVDHAIFEGSPIIWTGISCEITPTISLVINGAAKATTANAVRAGTYLAGIKVDSHITESPDTIYRALPLGAYVSSADGNDSNPGTIDYPVKTISRGIDIANTATLADAHVVLLQAGSVFTDTGTDTLNSNLLITQDIEFIRYGTGSDPLVVLQAGDIETSRFCIIDANVTVTMSHIDIEDGQVTGSEYGGAILNHGSLYLAYCKFGYNYAEHYGGAIFSDGLLQVYNSNFFLNTTAAQAGCQGGALYNGGTAEVHCCRFANNSAGIDPSRSNAIYTTQLLNATNNWWETNSPNPGNLFAYSPVIYTPYIIVDILPDPLWPRPDCPSIVTADFTHNSSGDSNECTIFNNTPVRFSSVITLSPTDTFVQDGYAETTLYDIPSNENFSVCVNVDGDIREGGYTICETATSYDLTEVWVSDIEGNDANLGNSPENPVKTIGRALMRLSCTSTDTLHIYLERGNTFAGTDNKDLTISATNIRILPYEAENGTAAPIIDMEQSGRFCTISADTIVTISGIVIQNGYITGVELPEYCGGAIFNNGILTAYSCTLSNNTVAYNAGAIFNKGSLSAINCLFYGNNAYEAGALWNDGTGRMTIDNCELIRNTANGVAGAIENITTATLSINNSLFYQNSAGYYAGAVANRLGTCVATHCTFSYNTATGNDSVAGVLYNTANLEATGCTFKNNAAGLGGVLFTLDGESIIHCCRCVDNTATVSGSALFNYNNSGTINATNNWWGTNWPDAQLLFGNTNVSYNPWVTLNLNIDPDIVFPGETVSFIATFSDNCIPNGIPLQFSTDSGTITPTTGSTINGTASTNLSVGYNELPFDAHALVGPGEENFELSLTITPQPLPIQLIKVAQYSLLYPGQLVEYLYTVSNSGNKPITNLIITDNKITYTICHGFTLGPSESTTCHTTYTISQADTDAGHITNTAQTSGLFDNTIPVSTTDSLTIPITPEPGIELVKTVEYTSLLGGSSLHYTYNVRNTGNVTLNSIVITDNKMVGNVCTIPTLASGETDSCSADYILTAEDFEMGYVTNTATAVGFPVAGDPVSDIDSITVTLPQTTHPGISIVKRIDNNAFSLTWPGAVVPLGSTMSITYRITNTGDSILRNIVVSDNQGYIVTQPASSLNPGEYMICTASAPAPALNSIHHDTATVTADGLFSTHTTATTQAYAFAVPTGIYRCNWTCICDDTGSQHYIVGSHNSTDFTNNQFDGWIFDEVPTPTTRNTSILALDSNVIIDSAIYNTSQGSNIALLTYDQENIQASIILATIADEEIVHQNTIHLPSMAFKLQWFTSPEGEPFIVADEYDRIALYWVDLETFTLSLFASTPNVAAGTPSSFLYWYIQRDQIYIIQGFDNINIATYKVVFGESIIRPGVTTVMGNSFSTINSCSTCFNYLVLSGVYNNDQAIIARYIINDFGHVTAPLTTRTFDDATTVHYCERCCCNGSQILVGTDNGLYKLQTNSLNTIASNISMSDNDWLNICWCCDSNRIYCIACNSNHQTFIFKEVGGNLIEECELQ